MSHLHFVAAREYQDRVIQLGEQPNMVFLVGGLGVDSIKKITLINKFTLEQDLNLKFRKRNLLVTFHPVTLEVDTAESQVEELLKALEELEEETTLIFTMPNADTDGRSIHRKIELFTQKHSNAYFYKSLGQLRYLSCLQFVDGVIGNSSSGLTEVPSFQKGTINIGDRQNGRLEAASVIKCQPDKKEIMNALNKLYSSEFQAQLIKVENPYGQGGASDAILKVIREAPLYGLLKKRFYNLKSYAHSLHR
jgi:GDP/UDP-N,N'-diacetylbacillosamine 2-epimerase (hydrolysing)